MGNSKNNRLPGKGDVIKGQHGTYELIKRLGHGGNGEVFDVRVSNKKPELPASETGYVIKILNSGKFKRNNREKRIQRFENEVRTVQSLEHQDLRIIPIYDSCLNLESEQLYKWYLMPKAKDYEYAGESSIEKLIQFRKLGDTIKAIHEKGITHRDIKPDNILMFNGNCCLTDFGLVWDINNDVHITSANEAVGPILIRPPEMDYDADRLTVPIDYKLVDVYLFAKTLWIFLTGVSIGFRGEYSRSDKQIYFDKGKLSLGDTIEPLHRMMEDATKHNNSDRISLEKCLELIDGQIEIAESRYDEKEIGKLKYDEAVSEAREQVKPDIVSYNRFPNILDVLGRINDIADLYITEFGDEYNIGTFLGVEHVKGNLFRIKVRNGFNPFGSKKNKIIHLSIAGVSILTDKSVEIFVEKSDEHQDSLKQYHEVGQIIRCQETEVVLNESCKLYTKGQQF